MERHPYDRGYMDLAVQVMLGSESEHISKPDPLVGAVIASPEGKLLDSVGRGNLRIGAHAEYQLLDRLLQDRDLRGSTLYVTLEPCTK